MTLWDLLIALSGLDDYAVKIQPDGGIVNARGEIEMERLEALRLAPHREGAVRLQQQSWVRH